MKNLDLHHQKHKHFSKKGHEKPIVYDYRQAICEEIFQIKSKTK